MPKAPVSCLPAASTWLCARRLDRLEELRDEKGVRSMVAAIEKEQCKVYVPAWPWAPLSFALRHAPLPLVRKMV